MPRQKPDTLQDFFDLLERALNHAPRPEILERLRPLFTMFLEVFDLPSNSEGAAPEVRRIGPTRLFEWKLI